MKQVPVILIIAYALSGCEPVSRLYDTPALYFGSPLSLPMADSSKRTAIEASAVLPLRAKIELKHKLTEKFRTHFFYCGNAGSYAKIEGSKIGNYSFSTDLVEGGLEWINKIKNSKTYWFLQAGYGSGRCVSKVIEDYNYYDFVVPANDRSVYNVYLYKGHFSKMSLAEGLRFNLCKGQHLHLINRQSFVNFLSYQLPDTSYKKKRQLLSDLTFSYSLMSKSFVLSVSLGIILNGEEPGNRLQDNKPELWRIERGFGGLTLSYNFLTKKGKGN